MRDHVLRNQTDPCPMDSLRRRDDLLLGLIPLQQFIPNPIVSGFYSHRRLSASSPNNCRIAEIVILRTPQVGRELFVFHGILYFVFN